MLEGLVYGGGPSVVGRIFGSGMVYGLLSEGLIFEGVFVRNLRYQLIFRLRSFVNFF